MLARNARFYRRAARGAGRTTTELISKERRAGRAPVVRAGAEFRQRLILPRERGAPFKVKNSASRMVNDYRCCGQNGRDVLE